MKDPRETVKAHVAQSGCEDILIKQSDSALMSHDMNFEIKMEAFRAVKSAFKTNLCSNVIWMSEEKDHVQYVVCCLQLYLDKSQSSIFASSYAF